MLSFVLSDGCFAQAGSATWTLTSNGNASNTGFFNPSGIVTGSGISSPSYSGSNGVSTSSWANDASSPVSNEYYEFTINADSGHRLLTITDIEFEHRTSSGSWLFDVRVSTDGWESSTLIGDNLTSSTSFNSVSTGSGFSIAVPQGGNFSMRVYAFESDGSNRSFRMRNVVIGGTTCAMPVITTQPVSQIICVGAPLNLSVSATGTGLSYQWKRGATNVGTGSTYSVANVTGANAGTYTVEVSNSCGSVTSANAVVTVNSQPTANGGGSTNTCSNQAVVMSGMTSSNGTISWTENGTGSITAGGTTLAPTYTPGAGENGTVTLTMTVSNAGCSSASADYTINVTAAPTANAGADITTCANSGAINIGGDATAGNSADLAWTTSGTGAFTNGNSLGAMYTPSSEDITAGSVTLTLTATGIGSCANAVDSKTLTINVVPETVPTEICQGGSGNLNATSNCPTDGVPVTPGARLAGAGTATGAGTAWVTPNLITVNDNQFATFSAAAAFSPVDATSQALRATNFGFNVPANATIMGVRTTFGRFRSGSGLTGNAQDNSVRLIVGGTPTGTNKGLTGTNWPTSEAAVTYGAANDMWGTAITPAQINASDFGIEAIVDLEGLFLASFTANIDYITVTVTYSLPGTLNWYTVSSGGSPIGSGTSFNPVGVAGSPLADTNTPGTTTFYAECSTVPGCRTATDFIINPLPEVSFTGFDGPYCVTADAVTLTGNYPAGTFTGAGITDNGNGTASFSPATAGIGTHSITYTYTDGNSCENSASQNVTVEIFSFYADNDGDGYGAGPLVPVCAVDANTPPAGYSLDGTDCNDAYALAHAEFEFYVDSDDDGYGTGELVSVCAVDANTPPLFYSTNNTDCNDNDGTMNTQYAFYVDMDGDGFGAGEAVMLCAVDANTPPDSDHSIYNTDCNDEPTFQHPTQPNTPLLLGSTIYPGAPEVGYNLIDDDCDGLVDEGFPAKSNTIQTGFCNTILQTIDQYVYANLIAGAPGYSWRVTTLDQDGNPAVPEQVQYLTTSLRAMKITSLANYAFNTKYRIEVGVFFGGYLQPYTASTCIVSTPDTKSTLLNCDQTITALSNVIYARHIPFATGYKFRITDPANPSLSQEIERPLREFRMTQITDFVVNYGKTYNVEVAIRNTDGVSYLGYGDVCAVNTPLFPTTGLQDSQCDGPLGIYEPASMGTQIFAYSYPGAISYEFRLMGPGLPPTGASITRPLRVFSLADFAGTGIIPGQVYNVNVRMRFNAEDPDGPFGKTCSIRVPGGARMAALDFKAVAYPNPFAENFSIDITTSLKDKVSVKVYDMTGRLLETRSVEASKMDALTVGDNYPSGVYNVIVTQGENISTLRVVKR